MGGRPIENRIKGQIAHCTKCGEAKSFPEDFYKDSRLRSGHRTSCKSCDNSFKRSDESIARKKAWIKENARERYFEYRYNYYRQESYRQKQREKGRKLRANGLIKVDREKKRESDRRYRQSPKGRLTKKRVKARRRSRVGTHTLTVDQWQSVLNAFAHACAYCLTPSSKLTADHFFPVSLGGDTVMGNIVPACHRCNSSKQHKLPEKWCTPEQLERVLRVMETL